VNLHYRGEQLERHLAGQDLWLVWERETILETGGGLKAVLPLLGPGPVMTLNPDVVWSGPNPLAHLAAAWTGEADALLLVAPVGRLLGRAGGADFRMDTEGRLTRAGGAAEGMVYLGAQIIRGEPVAAWPETVFSLNGVWDGLIAEGRLRGVAYPGLWCDVGSPAGLAEAEALLEARDG
jgi:MurNAc alpha-1-phosphate uridylyltransferase